MTLEECRSIALSLPLKDRAALVKDLLDSLEGINESEIEDLWVQEAEARYEVYKSGETESYSVEEVMRAARERLGCGNLDTFWRDSHES
jgi:putative addiction module component (TIGR02574 family)